jgi:hypothetical protein
MEEGMSTNQTIKSKPTTREYTERYQQTDMAKPELGRYCDGCGRLLCWCECLEIERAHRRVSLELSESAEIVEASCR